MAADRDEAQRIFDLECEYKWTAKTSSLHSRKAKLGRLDLRSLLALKTFRAH
jgi:hypothetical protein